MFYPGFIKQYGLEILGHFFQGLLKLVSGANGPLQNVWGGFLSDGGSLRTVETLNRKMKNNACQRKV